MPSFTHNERGCWNCGKTIKRTDDFIKIIKNKWTTNGISQRVVKNYCIKCALKDGLIDDV